MPCGLIRNPESYSNVVRISRTEDPALPALRVSPWSSFAFRISFVSQPLEFISTKEEVSLSSKLKAVTISESEQFRLFKTDLQEAKKILISTHQLPDGDG